MVGTTLGRYRIQSVLGHGGMGEVYAAVDPQLDRRVAIKIMAPEAAANGPMVERFLREGRAASALNHPNIVTIHEVGQTETGQLYIVQELVEGLTLRRLLTDGLPYDRVCHVGRQLAKALATAHGAGIVHRDIKPENVMVRPDGYIKVLDFGLAHITLPEEAASEMETASRVTAQGTIIGTTPYMSPEQIGGKPISASSDIFSLGVVFYEMLAGRLPFTGESSLTILSAIVNEHPVPLGRLKPELPVALASLVMAMLEKDRAARPSAVEVDDAFDKILGSGSMVAPVTLAAPRKTVGRETERRALLEVFQGTVSGRGRIATITGEPGIGKTSLVEEVLAEICGRSASAAHRAGPLLRAAEWRGSVPADPRGARQPAARSDHRSLHRHDEDAGADVVRARGHAERREHERAAIARGHQDRVARADETRTGGAVRKHFAHAAARAVPGRPALGRHFDRGRAELPRAAVADLRIFVWRRTGRRRWCSASIRSCR